MRRGQRAITRADFDAIRRGFTAAGLDEEYLDGNDVIFLWDRGKSVADIITTAVAHAKRSGETTATSGPV